MSDYLLKLDDVYIELENVSKRYGEDEIIFVNDLADVVFQCPKQRIVFISNTDELSEDMYLYVKLSSTDRVKMSYKTH